MAELYGAPELRPLPSIGVLQDGEFVVDGAPRNDDAPRKGNMCGRSPYTVAASMNALWALRWQQGRLEEIKDAIVQVEEVSARYAFLLPSLYRELDQREQAARSYAALAEDGFARLLERDATGVSHLFCLAVLADAAAYLRDDEHASTLYDALAPFAGRLAAVHPGLTAIAPVDQLLGQLSATTGDRRRSEKHFRAALAQCHEIGARTLAVRTQVAYAETLLNAGDAAARDTATMLLATAAETADELGMHGITQRLERLANGAIA